MGKKLSGRELAIRAIEEMGVTQGKIARMAGCSDATLSLYLHRNKDISPQLARRLAAVIKVSAAKLMDLD